MIFSKIRLKKDWIVIIAFILLPSVISYIHYFGFFFWGKFFKGDGIGVGLAILVFALILLLIYLVLVGYFVQGVKNKFFVYISAVVLLLCLYYWISGQSLWQFFDVDFGLIFLVGFIGILIGSFLKKMMNRLKKKMGVLVEQKEKDYFFAYFFSSITIIIFIGLISLILFDHSSGNRFVNSCNRTKSSQCFVYAAFSYPLEIPENFNPIIYKKNWERILGQLNDLRAYALFREGRIQEARNICVEEFQNICRLKCGFYSEPCSLSKLESIVALSCEKARARGENCEKEKKEIMACADSKSIPDEIFQACLQKSQNAYLLLEKKVRRGY